MIWNFIRRHFQKLCIPWKYKWERKYQWQLVWRGELFRCNALAVVGVVNFFSFSFVGHTTVVNWRWKMRIFLFRFISKLELLMDYYFLEIILSNDSAFRENQKWNHLDRRSQKLENLLFKTISSTLGQCELSITMIFSHSFSQSTEAYVKSLIVTYANDNRNGMEMKAK